MVEYNMLSFLSRQCHYDLHEGCRDSMCICACHGGRHISNTLGFASPKMQRVGQEARRGLNAPSIAFQDYTPHSRKRYKNCNLEVRVKSATKTCPKCDTKSLKSVREN